MDWLDLLAVQETLGSLLQHHSSKASILLCSAFLMAQLLHPHLLDFSSSLACQFVSYFSRHTRVYTHTTPHHTYTCDSFLYRRCSRSTLIITKKISDEDPDIRNPLLSFLQTFVSQRHRWAHWRLTQTRRTSFHKVNGSFLCTAFCFQDHSMIENILCWRWV